MHLITRLFRETMGVIGEHIQGIVVKWLLYTTKCTCRLFIIHLLLTVSEVNKYLNVQQ